MKVFFSFLLGLCLAASLAAPGGAQAATAGNGTSPVTGSKLYGAFGAHAFSAREHGNGTPRPHREYDSNLGFAADSLEHELPALSFHSDVEARRQLTKTTESLGMVTGINSRLFTPLGPYQLFLTGEDGKTGSLESFNLGGIGITPEAGVYWHSNNYADYYGAPGKTQGMSPNSDTSQEYSPYLGLTLDVPLNDKWSAFINGEVAFPGDKLRENRTIDNSPTQSVTTGIVYTFW